MNKTLTAYIYNKETGLLEGYVVSNDYPSEAAFRVVHVLPTQDAYIELRDDFQITDPVEFAKASKSPDEIQDLITNHSGIIPPPKVRYALVDTDGIVFDVIETRRVDDPRLSFNKTIPNFEAKPNDEAMPLDKIKLDGSLVKYVPPKPVDMAEPNITIAELKAQRDAALKDI